MWLVDTDTAFMSPSCAFLGVHCGIRYQLCPPLVVKNVMVVLLLQGHGSIVTARSW